MTSPLDRIRVDQVPDADFKSAVQRQADRVADKLDEATARLGVAGFAAQRLANAQTFTTGAYTICTFDTEERDDDNCFEHRQGVYRAPASGWYLFSGAVTCTNLDIGERAFAALFVNDVLKYAGPSHFSAGANLAVRPGLSALVYLDKDDEVTMRVQHDEGANQPQSVAIGGINYFTGIRFR